MATAEDTQETGERIATVLAVILAGLRAVAGGEAKLDPLATALGRGPGHEAGVSR